MRRVLVMVLVLLAAVMVAGARSSKEQSVHAQPPSRKLLRQTPRAERMQGRGMKERRMHGPAGNAQPGQQTAARSPVRSSTPQNMNPANTAIGLLAAASLWPQALYPENVAAGDFNGDGIPDLVFDSYASDGATQHLYTMLAKGDGSFEAPSPLPVSFPPHIGMAWQWFPRIVKLFTADLNGDKKDDFVVLQADGKIDVYLNDGAGRFVTDYTSYHAFPGGVGCSSTYTDWFWGWITDYGPGCESYTVADVNQDGSLDLVVAYGNQYSELVNNQDGTFQAAMQQTISFSDNSWSPTVVADLNGDGFVDIAREGSDEEHNTALEVFLHSEAGFSTTPAFFAKPKNSSDTYSLAAADVNGDGLLDVVSLDADSQAISVFYQDHQGKFTAKGPFFAGDRPAAMTVADLNGDSKAEIVLSTDYDGVLTVMGGGDSLSSQAAYAVGGWPYTPVAVADFSHDGQPDIVAPNDMMDLAYLQNLGDGTFKAARFFYPTPNLNWWDNDFVAYPWTLATGDLNGDGIPEVVTGVSGNEGHASSVGAIIFLGNSDGSLQPGINLGLGGGMYSVALGDISGDGNLDIVAADQHDSTIKIYFGDGKGAFPATAMYPSGVAANKPFGLVVADLNADGAADVAVRNYEVVSVLLNDGKGNLQAPVDYVMNDAEERGDYRLAAADLNGDGVLDLVSQGRYEFELLLGNKSEAGKGDGTFQAAAVLDIGSEFSFNLSDFKLADVNGDGALDVVAALNDWEYDEVSAVRRNTASREGWEGVLVALNLNDTTGKFSPAGLHRTTLRDENESEATPVAVAVADINGDGAKDILVTNTNYGNVAILYGQKDSEGTYAGFSDPLEFLGPLLGFGLAVTDMNLDHAPDVVVAGFSDFDYLGGIAIMENTGGVKLTVVSSQNPAREGEFIALSLSLKPSARGVTGVPTGTVSIYEGMSKVDEGTLENGAASFLLANPLTAGVHEFTAAYLGDANFLPTSAVLVQLASGPNDYDLAADKTDATVKAGQSAMFTLTITPKNGFMGTVSFSCGALPAGVSCGFDPSSVTPNGKDPVEVVLTIHTTAAATSAALAPLHGNSQLPLWATLWGAGVMGMVVAGSRKRKLIFLLSLMAPAILLAVLAACGGAKTVTSTVTKEVPSVTPAGLHIMTVTATSVGGTPKPLNLKVTVE